MNEAKLKKLEKLEEKFNTATELIDELVLPVTEVLEPEIIEPGTDVELRETSLFTMSQLKQDFEMIRRNTMKLINNGQQLLDRAQLLDISDMKASQLEALSSLQGTIGANLKMMMEIYKDLVDIENNTGKKQAKEQAVAVNNGTVNNITFTGTNSDLLKLINENSK